MFEAAKLTTIRLLQKKHQLLLTFADKQTHCLSYADLRDDLPKHVDVIAVEVDVVIDEKIGLKLIFDDNYYTHYGWDEIFRLCYPSEKAEDQTPL